MQSSHPIGIFDSGYGGLTVFKSIAEQLSNYDYIYMGDNARAPYGNRSFETVHEYTLECVEWFFKQGCPLVILACNTASAKALRTIQQQNLPYMEDPTRRVLGVIRPTAEVIGNYTKTGSVGVLGTRGTVTSGSYPIEINHFYPSVKVRQLACPMWVPLIENNEYQNEGADYFVKKYLDQLLTQDADIDTILLACTHYPLLLDKIRQILPTHITAVAQGDIVASSLADYLQRHPEMEQRLTKNSVRNFYTTDDPAGFDEQATIFFGQGVKSAAVEL
ncbi:MAG: glutamate racemase [Sphingobacteriales bacterium]|nr:MAG: glutamate racemase [Sphingobacteriales bacterium]